MRCARPYTNGSPLSVLPDAERWHALADDFLEVWQLPNCIGALDDKHVVMQKPAGTGALYHNYKGFCSVVLAVADARYR